MGGVGSGCKRTRDGESVSVTMRINSALWRSLGKAGADRGRTLSAQAEAYIVEGLTRDGIPVPPLRPRAKRRVDPWL